MVAGIDVILHIVCISRILQEISESVIKPSNHLYRFRPIQYPTILIYKSILLPKINCVIIIQLNQISNKSSTQ